MAHFPGSMLLCDLAVLASMVADMTLLYHSKKYYNMNVIVELQFVPRLSHFFDLAHKKSTGMKLMSSHEYIIIIMH